MASVIASARRSTTGVFDLISDTTASASSALRSVNLAADMLHLKARETHAAVQARTISNMTVVVDREIMLAADEYTDMLHERHRRLYPEQEFDYAAQYEAIVKKMTLAHNTEKGA